MSWFQELVRLEGLFQELLSLARVSLGLVEQDELEALADTWARRQRVVKQIATCSRRLRPCFQDWERVLAGLEAGQAARARELVEAVTQLGRRVAELDERAGARLCSELEQVRREMRRLKQGSQVVRAYRRPLPGGQQGPCRLSRTG